MDFKAIFRLFPYSFTLSFSEFLAGKIYSTCWILRPFFGGDSDDRKMRKNEKEGRKREKKKKEEEG